MRKNGALASVAGAIGVGASSGQFAAKLAHIIAEAAELEEMLADA